MIHIPLAPLLLAALASPGALPMGGHAERLPVPSLDGGFVEARTDSPPPPPEAAASPDVAWMTVEIWPEYDDPGVLVIHRGALARSSETPTDFSFVIPPGARIHMAGGIAPDGGHIHGRYETRDRDDGLVEVSYRLEVSDFYMEFYYDPITGEADRSFTYPVVSPWDVPSLAVSVQVPRRAEGFALSPSTGEVVQDDRGFDYYVTRWSDVAAGTSRPVTVSYRKDDSRPSVAPPEAPGGSEPARSASGPEDGDRRGQLPAILAVLLAAAGTYFVVLGWPRSEPAEEAGAPPPRPAPPNDSGAVPRFCSHCGKDIALRDRYCAWCGEATRVTEGMCMAAS